MYIVVYLIYGIGRRFLKVRNAGFNICEVRDCISIVVQCQNGIENLKDSKTNL